MVADNISYTRFWELYSRFTFFSKKDKVDSKIIKKPKIFKYLEKRFQSALTPGENLAIDESMCAFKGRVLNRVYEPSKPDKFGNKLYTICDSASSYLFGFTICREKTTINETVTNLLHQFTGVHRILHMEHWYNSIELSKELLAKKLHTNGTYRKRRGVSTDFWECEVQQYKFQHKIHSQGISIINYNDNKTVVLGTTAFQDEYLEIKKKNWIKSRITGRKEAVDVIKHIPKAIDAYNRNMNAVDRFNKSIKSLGLRRPAKKWDRKLSVFLIESMIVNSYILFRKPHTKYNKTDYLEDLVLNYLSYDAEENHFCQEAEKQGRCVVCYKQTKRKVTYHQCGKYRNF